MAGGGAMSGNLNDLASHQSDLLLAEIAGWLHDMGKCADEHITQQASDSPPGHSYQYKKAHSSLIPSSLTLSLLGETITLRDLVEKARPKVVADTSAPWLLRALGRCHAAAHIEKEEADDTGKQAYLDTRMSSAFGLESVPSAGLTTKLTSLPFTSISSYSLFREAVRIAFSKAPGDTRRPENEVTLWDWSGTVAAMYKAALAGALLGYQPDPDDLKWRLLSLRVSESFFYERALRSPDLLAHQKIVSDAFERVRLLLEETYPLGTRIYQDKSNGLYVVPNLPDLLDHTDAGAISLRSLIQNEFDKGTIKGDGQLAILGEVVPKLDLDLLEWWAQSPDRNPAHNQVPPIADILRDDVLTQADAQRLSIWWNNVDVEICTVCRLRPQGPTIKSLERKVCDTCEKRREDRSENWASKLDQTIWLDEVADINGRLALLGCSFDLRRWLDGIMVKTLAVTVPNAGTATPKTPSFARLRRIWETTGEFWEHSKEALSDLAGKRKYRLILQGQLSKSIGPSHSYDARVGKIETSFVCDGTRLISADNLRYLAKQLNLELPDKAEEKAVADAVRQKLQEFEQLELFEKPSRQGQPVKVAILSDFKVDLEQHDYSPVIPLLAEPQIFIALVPADKAMKVICHLRDEYEKQMSKVRNRLPLHLNLLTFNRRVPLYVAMDAVRRMLDRKTESAAQWRVTEAANFDDSAGKLGKHAMRIRLSPSPGNQWVPQQITAGVSYNLGDDSKDFYYSYFFVTQANEDKANGGKPLTERPHHWQAIHPTYKPTAAHGFTDLVHVSELCKDDTVLYSPSTFDFEHLDVAGRRFELNYDPQSGIRVAPANRLHPFTRPFLLEEIADLETVWDALKKLPGGQRDFLVRLIETKRTEWKVTTANDATLGRFARDTLRQAGNNWWKNLDDERRRLLEEWAANGRLADALELCEKMMKLEIE
jgi:hypothetical protein